MTEYVQSGGIQVAKELYDFINDKAIPGTGLESQNFWAKFDKLVNELAPKNRALLAKREDLQAKIDAYHTERAGQPHNAVEYKAFLQEIGYLLPEGEDFAATTVNVEPEIAQMAGPQLVVPIMNARFALNASNARWGSLYDALYGTKAISEENGATKGPGYNQVRGDKVIAYARNFLNESAPLATGDHADSTKYAIVDGALAVTLKDGSTVGLKEADKLQGFVGDAAAPTGILLKNNGLRFELQFDAASPIG
ncbi:MAG: malate synthase G, partial [Oleispira sp.]|nr:malate synthase G [Oleispira sp.]